MAHYTHDVAVIGGGAAGLTAAKTARGFGKRVVLIEKGNSLGGECTWTGCVPSKALIKAAEVAHTARCGGRFGITSSVKINSAGVMSHVRSSIKQIYTTHTPEKIEKLGIIVCFGAPQLQDAHTILVNGETIIAKKIILATGSSPFVPRLDGIDTVNYLTNETLFNIDELPKSLIVLGGGAIGAEMASAFNRLGTQVTIVERNETILNKEEPDLVARLTDIMKREGVTIVTKKTAVSVAKSDSDVVLTCTDAIGTPKTFAAERLLIAVGRTPNITGLGLDAAGVKYKKHGIIVDSTLRTTARNIYACGDVVGPYQFSHMAWYQGVIAARNALIPLFKKHVDYTHKVWATFTAPELAAAGLTEKQARAQHGDTIQVYQRGYDTIDRSVTDGATDGIVKVICDSQGRILGAHILGVRAGDIIHELQVAKVHGIKFPDLQKVIHAYPSYAELIWHLSKRAYVDRLERNIFIRIAKKLFGRK